VLRRQAWVPGYRMMGNHGMVTDPQPYASCKRGASTPAWSLFTTIHEIPATSRINHLTGNHSTRMLGAKGFRSLALPRIGPRSVSRQPHGRVSGTHSFRHTQREILGTR
jgi:hypothetical protein